MFEAGVLRDRQVVLAQCSLHRAAQCGGGALEAVAQALGHVGGRGLAGGCPIVPLPGVDLDAVQRPGLGVALWFRATGVQALHDRLHAAGVPIVKAPEDGPFGRMFTFVGPEGYAITTHEG